MNEILKQIGLSDNEALVYLTLINEGDLQAGKIASKSGIHRRSVYDAIERLIEKGLVGYIKNNNIKIYSATNPLQLLEITRKKEEAIKEKLPVLQALYNSKKEKKETLFYRGKNGVKKIFEDQIIEGKEILILGASTKAYETLKFYLPHYDNDRIKKNINTRIIFDEIIKKEKLKIPLSKIKYLSKEFLGPTATNIYGDNVALIIWTKNPYAILIKDKDVADTYKNFFEAMWNIAKK